MDPFHVVALAGTKLDLCRQRVQQQTCGHRGRTGDPLYRVRRTLRTRLPAAQRSPTTPADRSVRRRHPPRRRADLERLPAPHRRLQPPRPPPRQNHDGGHHRLPATRRARRIGGTGPTRPHPAPAPPRRTGLLRPPRLQRPHRSHQRTPRSTYAETPSDSETSPTTESAHYCTAATSPNGSMHSDSGRAYKPLLTGPSTSPQITRISDTSPRR